jgi:hypothetical protein
VEGVSGLQEEGDRRLGGRRLLLGFHFRFRIRLGRVFVLAAGAQVEVQILDTGVTKFDLIFFVKLIRMSCLLLRCYDSMSNSKLPK